MEQKKEADFTVKPSIRQGVRTYNVIVDGEYVLKGMGSAEDAGAIYGLIKFGTALLEQLDAHEQELETHVEESFDEAISDFAKMIDDVQRRCGGHK